MAELTKLLGFMSSWDRQKVLAEYEEKFSCCESEEKLIKELGSPTKNAVQLAASYVPTPPPAAIPVSPEKPDSEAAVSEEGVQIGFEDLPTLAENEDDRIASENVRNPKKTSSFGRAVFWILAIVIGIPVTIVAACVGIPFLGAGAGILLADVVTALKIAAGLHLLSDILLTIGAALLLCALGLLLCWLGIWISMELCYLWVAKVWFAIWKKGNVQSAGNGMAKAWHGFLLLAVCVFAAGIVIGGVGWLTGASASRIIELSIGSAEKAQQMVSEGIQTLLRYRDALLSCLP